MLHVLDSVEIVSLAVDANSSSSNASAVRAEVSLKLRLQGAGEPSAAGSQGLRRAVGWYVFSCDTTSSHEDAAPLAVTPEHAAIHQSVFVCAHALCIGACYL
jgi:hypothetical protein